MDWKLWCGRGDLNPHASRRHPLKMVCLPFHHFRIFRSGLSITKLTMCCTAGGPRIFQK